jgi:hypothetical protein
MGRDFAAEIFARLTRRARREHVAQVSSRHTELLGKLRLSATRCRCELFSQSHQHVLLDPLDARVLVLKHAITLVRENLAGAKFGAVRGTRFRGRGQLGSI